MGQARESLFQPGHGADRQIDNRAGSEVMSRRPFASARAGRGKADLSDRSLDIASEVHYYCVVIVSFRGREAEKIWNGYYSKRFPSDIQRAAKRKFLILHASIRLEDLKIPPGNRLHPLSGDRKGQWSISINDQWRICFEWREGNAFNVEITDYHS